ncbi:hypothetical protein KGM_211578 [Danaus plexippus plexippus]|uniref:Uncharacterized protein n=1 Tax=Danaus plexippus plexippus TaxID=278856 RepID=A0A212F534_DANPL|nr:hypothetical protein KGM_211578 [Danaus plexippus plexippus]
MQRPIQNPMMTCGVPSVPYNVMPTPQGQRRISMGPCFNPAPSTFQPNSCFMSASALRKTSLPSMMPPRTRYDPCFREM